MNIQAIKALYKKELTEVLRDKKTLFVMIVLPLILYPALFIVIMQVVMMIEQDSKEMTYSVGYITENESVISDVTSWIESDDDELDYSFKRKETDKSSYEQSILDEKLDIAVAISEKNGQTKFKIYYDSSETNSANAADMYKEELDSYCDHVAVESIEESGGNAEAVLHPIIGKLKDLASNESMMGNLLGTIIPFLLLTGVLMGAMSPAIDATAGEKERGTLETLMCMPLSGSELIMGKFLSVATVSVVSVFFDILSMSGIGVYVYKLMEDTGEAVGSFDVLSFIPAIIITVLCLFAYALFMSALVMCVCAFAKSFKEANNYITPISIVVLLGGYISFIPNVELTSQLAMIPVVNITLLVKQLLAFDYNFTVIPIVLLSNIVYAFAAIMILGRVYSSEAILFSEGGGSLHIFERRSNIKKNTKPSIAESIFVMIVALLLMNYIGSLVVLKDANIGILVQQLFVLLLPVGLCLYIKSDMKEVFSLRAPKPAQALGFIAVGLGITGINIGLGELLSKLLPESVERVGEQFGVLMDDMNMGLALILIAVLPAICEEMMFRGLMFSAFSEKLKPYQAIIGVGFMFALMHMSLVRFIPTFILGCYLCFVVKKTKSIYVPMVIHFINNAIAVYLSFN